MHLVIIKSDTEYRRKYMIVSLSDGNFTSDMIVTLKNPIEYFIPRQGVGNLGGDKSQNFPFI